MLDPAYIREHFDAVVARLGARSAEAAASLSRFQALEAERRRLIPLVENLKRDQNAAGEAVARAKRAGQDPSAMFSESKARGAQIKKHEAELADVDEQRDALLLTIPNLPHESVPT